MVENISTWVIELTDEEMKRIGGKTLDHREIIKPFDPQLVRVLCGMNIHE